MIRLPESSCWRDHESNVAGAAHANLCHAHPPTPAPSVAKVDQTAIRPDTFLFQSFGDEMPEPHADPMAAMWQAMPQPNAALARTFLVLLEKKPRDWGGRHTLQEGTPRDETSICVSPRSYGSVSLIGIASPLGSAGGIFRVESATYAELAARTAQRLREAAGSCHLSFPPDRLFASA